MPPKPAPPKDQTDDLPYWIPGDPESPRLSKGLQSALASVLKPLYQGLVLQAPDELERSAGLTIVHLAWLEMCQHVEMADVAADSNGLLAAVKDLDQQIAAHLEVVAAKGQTTELLMKVRAGGRLLRCVENRLDHQGPLPLTLPADSQ